MKYFNLNLKIILIILTSLFMLSGCSSLKVKQAVADANDPVIVKKFESNLALIAQEIKNDPNYHRIPLDSKEEQEWFATIAFLYWDTKYTRAEFIAQGVKRFPAHRDAFEYLAKRIKQ